MELHLFLRELLALSEDPQAALPDIGMRFADYVETLSNARRSDRWRRSRDYWRARLDDFPAAPTLPTTPRRVIGERPRFKHVSARLNAGDWSRITAFCAQAGLTPNILACAAYCEILARYSGTSRFVISVLYSGRIRHLPEAGNVLGNFGTTILLEIDAAEEKTFLERARAIQDRFWNDADNADFSGIEVMRAIRQRNGGNSLVGIPVTFTTVSAPPASAGLNDVPLCLDHATARLEVPQVHLDHQVHFGQDGDAVFSWDFVEQVFPTGLVEDMAAAHHDLMVRLVRDEALWHTTDLDTNRADPPPSIRHAAGLQRLEAAFEHRARETPDAVALIIGETAMSYGELRRRAHTVAGLILEQELPRGALIGILMRKGWEQVAAALGVLYAGAAYVPVDPELPQERMNVLLAESGVGLVLTQAGSIPGPALPGTVRPIQIDLESTDGEARPDLPQDLSLSDLAYVIFTSGSTGVPKGVMIDHRGAANTIADINDRFTVSADDRLLALSSLSFDLSVYDIFGTLAAGAALVLPEPDHIRDVHHWRSLVAAHRVTIWNSVPALMQLAVEGADRVAMASLRLVMLSGDWIPLSLPDRIRALTPEAMVYSLGGATEASIWSNLYRIGEISPEWRSIPYGRAMRHQTIQVLDATLANRPTWVAGDIHIGGDGLAIGYLNDEARTAASFIIHPRTGARLYRTGDRGRYLPSGEIEFLGRSDSQVKIQGYRIECAEIESVILRRPDVKETLVTAVADQAGTLHLVGYVVPRDINAPPAHDQLRRQIGAALPAYMVPTSFVTLKALPLSGNGKVARALLPKPEFSHRPDNAPVVFEPPKGPLEEALAGIWSDVLDSERIGRRDNFFALGGTSFAGMRLTARLEGHFGRPLPFAALVSHPTIAELAELLASQSPPDDDGLVVRISAGRADASLVCVHPIGGNVTCYTELARHMGSGAAVYGIRAPGLAAHDGAPLESIPAMAERYIAELRAFGLSGPYRLVGWSLGGLVVQEMARRLAAAGEAPALVAMIDSAVLRPAADSMPSDKKAHFVRFASDLAAMSRLPLPTGFDDIADGPQAHWFTWLSRHMEEHGTPVGRDVLAAVFRVFSAGTSALDHHTVQSYDGDLILFCANTRPDAERVQQEWQPFARRLEVIPLDADHYSIMTRPSVTTIASRLLAWS
ncbi:non-ribosomal peptide synthetase [Nitratireductor aquibiodomus]|uniref:non-ribosomal peptide synthetase n=1 Tax=Nitratireductor aquibiodomus TaxID=204799 RepID=UPI000469DC4A|nr:non-ribosomal peptide synthetase [Nitratireductor aquibiodomus]